MAKREIRAVATLADVSVIIDRGADVDAEIKNLGFEDKGLKVKISEVAQNQLDEGELSVRLLGRKSAAVVSGVEKVELDASAEQFPKVREAIDKGLLTDYVERTLTLVVPSDVAVAAADVLSRAGIRASVQETLKVSSEAFRKVVEVRSTSLEKGEAEAALLKCVKRDVSFRVKYERI